MEPHCERLIDVRHMSYNDPDRKQMIKIWIDNRLHCGFGGGHRWERHYYDDKIKAHIWLCGKCSWLRITQTRCNDIWVVPPRTHFVALLMTNDFFNNKELWKKEATVDVLSKVVRHVLKTGRFRRRKTPYFG